MKLLKKDFGITLKERTTQRLLKDISGSSHDMYCVAWAQFPDALLKAVEWNPLSLQSIEENEDGTFKRAIFIHYGAAMILKAVGQSVFGIDGAHNKSPEDKIHQLSFTGAPVTLRG